MEKVNFDQQKHSEENGEGKPECTSLSGSKKDHPPCSKKPSGSSTMVFMILVQFRDWTPSVYLMSHELRTENRRSELNSKHGSFLAGLISYLSHSLMGSSELTGTALIIVTFLL